MNGFERPPNASTLVLAPSGRDAEVICSALKEAGLVSSAQSSLPQLVCNLRSAAAAVITEEALIHEDRSELARWLAEQPPWSDFPFILLTLRSSGNGHAISDLIELLGNVTVLERPLAATSLKSAVRAALRARARQRESEQYLGQLQELTTKLEQRVEERTRQLSEANARLVAEIAERERTEAALRQAQKMEAVGQLTGGIAHDFNNLLMAVTGNLEMLKARLRDENLLRYTGNAMHAAQRGANLVNQLLAFSRKQHLDPQPVDVNELIGNIEELIARTIGQGIRIEDHRQSDLWPAAVDPTQLELMILNLAINARDAMPKGGTLTIETRNLEERPPGIEEIAQGAYVCVVVRDTGIGMSQDVLARAFDPFFTTKPPGRGTGLGLSQVYGFARQSGGAVRIESEAGAGTVVRIFLPRSDRPVVPPPKSNAEDNDRFVPGAILVVDDDPDVLQSAQGMLEDLGYRATPAASSKAALALLEKGSFDLALVDLTMPGMSGLELAGRIRESQPQICVLFCSGYPEHLPLQAEQLARENFISKPYQPGELAAQIKRILKSRNGA